MEMGNCFIFHRDFLYLQTGQGRKIFSPPQEVIPPTLPVETWESIENQRAKIRRVDRLIMPRHKCELAVGGNQKMGLRNYFYDSQNRIVNVFLHRS